MATRSRVGIELKNGSILSIYSHWDGYPEWVGRILKTHYNTREKVASLIDGGDVSSLWTDKDWNGNEWSDCKYKALTYAMRGEECPPRHDADLNEYLCNGEEYAYLFTNGEWVCYDLHGDVHPDIVKQVEIPSGALAV
jgi:hypothetical protein